MRYIPHTPDEVRRMLEAIGATTVDELFRRIPAENRLTRELDLPAPLAEGELAAHMRRIAQRNTSVNDALCFLGGGVYHHYSPVVVDQLIMRSEFYTAYTPYQPEIAQGTLQAIFEFQSMVAALLEMDICNASMYDGSTSVAEAALMAERLKKKGRILVARSLNPSYREVLATMLEPLSIEIEEVPFEPASGQLDRAALAAALERGPASGVLVQSPNVFGVVEELEGIAELAHSQESLLVATFSEALAFACLRPPGASGADIVAGEGQSLGIPLSFGGPALGLFACRSEFVRSMPGRLAGETIDVNGNRCFVLTMSTREQHIRREKATSNICTNQGLCALTATIYLATMGPFGLERVARRNIDNAAYLRRSIAALPGFRVVHQAPVFNELVVSLPVPPREAIERLAAEGLVPGISLTSEYPEIENPLLITTTEMHADSDLERLVEALGTLA
ncbi:MAG: aminomethyl-transferring glycine dehydrogenase subunit GcvPA [Myxococcales bacterium]|nr:aminomethyl-transferring glycine dehydrogenase subunit GcvPA [Myxococcales bacterium]